MALTTSAGTGAQTTTDSPQTAGQSNLNAAGSGNVQPGTARNLLTSQGGVPLGSATLSTVNLSSVQPSSHVATPAPKPAHHFNGALFGISALLLLIALVLFWTTANSVKTTTK